VTPQFVPLPARPMEVVRYEPDSAEPDAVVAGLLRQLSALHPDSVVRVELQGAHATAARAFLGAARLRSLAPASMNIELAPDRQRWE